MPPHRCPKAVHSTENGRAGAGRRSETPRDARDGSSRVFTGARFLTTAAEWRQLPSDGAPEVAFAGRSNAGKSAAINAIAGQGGLAKVSKTPGRTQHINFFRLREGGLIADLPGYGYAAVAKTARRHWSEFLTRYLSERATLAGLVLVMDMRHPLTLLDQRMLDWFLPTGRPARILLTKADKLSSTDRTASLRQARETLLHEYALFQHQLSVQVFSALRGLGIDEARTAIAAWLTQAATQKERPRHQGE
jgi:GTP-binding protein